MTFYSFKPAACIDADPQKTGEMCATLSKDGRLTPANLVEANKPEGTPLHNYFEWDDKKAGQLYRESQAGHVIRAIVVRSEDQAEEKTVNYVRSFFAVERDHTYEPTEVILKSEDKRSKLYAQARYELQSFERKYTSLDELSGVFAEIEKLTN